MKQLQKDLCMENLLFLTIMLQLQNYLIHNGFWHDAPNDYYRQTIMYHLSLNKKYNKNYQINLPSNVPLSPIILNIIMNKDDDYNNISDYNIFKQCIEKIFKQFIESQKALFEINISGVHRAKITTLYNKMSHNNQTHIKKNQFWDMWIALVNSCNDVFENMYPILITRYKSWM